MRLRRVSERRTSSLSIHGDVRLQPLALGTLHNRREGRDPGRLPPRVARRVERCPARDPLRQRQDHRGSARCVRTWRAPLTSRASRCGQAIQLHAMVMPAASTQNEGQGRTIPPVSARFAGNSRNPIRPRSASCSCRRSTTRSRRTDSDARTDRAVAVWRGHVTATPPGGYLA
jgi:hypothetical protein